MRSRPCSTTTSPGISPAARSATSWTGTGGTEPYRSLPTTGFPPIPLSRKLLTDSHGRPRPNPSARQASDGEGGPAHAGAPELARRHDLPPAPVAEGVRSRSHLCPVAGALPLGRAPGLAYGRRRQSLRRDPPRGHPHRRPARGEGAGGSRRSSGRPARLRARPHAGRQDAGRRPRGDPPARHAACPHPHGHRRAPAGADGPGGAGRRGRERARGRGARGQGPEDQEMMVRRSAAVAVWALASALLLAGCSDNAAGKARVQAPPVPVTVSDAVEKTLPVQLTAVGNAQAYTTVGIKSQVNGQIMEVGFKEGQDVKKGDLLFVIDPRPFEAALRQAEAALGQRQAEVQQAQANLERDQAQLDNAKVQERRYRDLVDRELIAREQYDQLRTNWAALEATVAADRAAVENAKASTRAAQANVDSARLQVAYTTIRAPIDGRTGNLLVQNGNIVKANDDNPIVVINQIHPIYVSFAVPEQNLTDIKKFYREAGGLKVIARLPRQKETLATGDLSFVNNAVDMTTATIQLKATFANMDNVLWPGQFLDVSLVLTSRTAIVVPSQAIQPGQKGPYVFVVKPDMTVESRPVVPGTRLGAETVIEQGVRGAERIVTDGQLRLIPGAKIEIRAPKAS